MNNLLYEPLTFGVSVASRCEWEDMLKHKINVIIVQIYVWLARI